VPSAFNATALHPACHTMHGAVAGYHAHLASVLLHSHVYHYSHLPPYHDSAPHAAHYRTLPKPTLRHTPSFPIMHGHADRKCRTCKTEYSLAAANLHYSMDLTLEDDQTIISATRVNTLAAEGLLAMPPSGYFRLTEPEKHNIVYRLTGTPVQVCAYVNARNFIVSDIKKDSRKRAATAAFVPFSLTGDDA